MTTKKDFIELGEWQLNALKQRDKYRQALEEIRIISQNWTSKLMNDGYCEILDKINEVLNGRN